MLVRSAPNRRRWPVIVALLVVGLAVLWTAAWFIAAGRVEETVNGWKAREAQSGRVYACASEAYGGYPFGIHMRCEEPSARLTSLKPSMAADAQTLLVQAWLWQPTVLTAALAGPLTVEAPGQGAPIVGRWTQAGIAVHGLPQEPRQVDVALEEPAFVQSVDPKGRLLFQAERLNVRGTMLEGSARASPVIQVSANVTGATAPALHPAAVLPVDGELLAVLRGLKDFAPKPWAERFRELQAAGGRIQIKSARLAQGESIAIAQGELGLSANGRLDGQIEVTVTGLEKLLNTLGLDGALPKGANNQMNAAFGALDRLAPGLGRFARNNAGSMVTMGLAFIGKPTQLEGRRAVTVPLRFSDGAVSLGPLKLGDVPALY